MLLAAGGAALQVGAHAGERRVDVGARELELDVGVEPVEALLAADLRARPGPEQRASMIVRSISRIPSRCARSLRRASCSVL